MIKLTKFLELKGDFKLVFDNIDDGASWYADHTAYDSSGTKLYTTKK